MYINVGARVLPGGSDIPTKRALQAVINANPRDCEFYGTSPHGSLKEGNSVTCDNLVTGDKYSVVGPNPYTSRKWYATVEKLPNGTIKVS